ncbi:putative protein N(5)-glutamine methyltransferase [Agromyces soli]
MPATHTPPEDPLVASLRRAGCVFAEDEARLLREAAGGPTLEALVERRIAGEPLEQLLGWAEFAGLRIVLEPGVFVPRSRTALVARLAIEALDELAQQTPTPREPAPIVIDLCCGAGAIGAVVLTRRPGVRLVAADLDPAAVRAARRNLEPLGATVVEGDLFAALPASLRGRVALIAANAPYVPSEAIALMPHEARDHEHRVALDGGADGLELHRRIAAGAGEWLRPGGRLVIECAAGQADASAATFRAAGLEASAHRDDELEATAVVARRAR